MISKEVEIIIGRFLKHYESLGYDIPKYYNKQNNKMFCKKGTKIFVKVEDLPINSHVKVDVLCDYCLEEGIEKHIPQTWQVYNDSKKLIIQKDCCKKHWFKKCSESNMLVYGKGNQFILD